MREFRRFRIDFEGSEKGGYIEMSDTAYGAEIDINGKARVYIDMWEFRDGRDGDPLLILDAGSDSAIVRLHQDKIIVTREVAE